MRELRRDRYRVVPACLVKDVHMYNMFMYHVLVANEGGREDIVDMRVAARAQGRRGGDPVGVDYRRDQAQPLGPSARRSAAAGAAVRGGAGAGEHRGSGREGVSHDPHRGSAGGAGCVEQRESGSHDPNCGLGCRFRFESTTAIWCGPGWRSGSGQPGKPHMPSTAKVKAVPSSLFSPLYGSDHE